MTDTAPQRMTIDIYSDVMCPWCLIGYGQLTKALDQLDGEIEAQLRWRPFELNPDMPQQGEEQEAHLQRKYRRSGTYLSKVDFRNCSDDVLLDTQLARRQDQTSADRLYFSVVSALLQVLRCNLP